MITYTLWNAVSGEFDSDWHRTEAEATQYHKDCGLDESFRVVGLTDAQCADIYAVSADVYRACAIERSRA